MIIKWLVNKLIPFLQVDEGMLNIYRRLDKLEADSHPPIFSRDELGKIKKKIEDLEIKAFVDKTSKYDWQGSD